MSKETLTRWQDPTIEEYKQLIKNWKEKYHQMKEERDKYKEILDKIKEYLEEDDWTSVNGVIAVKLIKEKLNELLEEIE